MKSSSLTIPRQDVLRKAERKFGASSDRIVDVVVEKVYVPRHREKRS